MFETAGENRAKIGFGNYGAENYHLRFGTDLNDSNALALTASRRVLDNDWRRWNEFDTNQVSLKHGLMLEDGSTLESELSYSEANLQLPGSMSEIQYEEFKSSGEQNETQDAWKHSGRYSNIWFFNSRLEKELGSVVFKPRLYFNNWSHYHPVTGAINDNPETNVYGVDLEFTYDHQLWGNSSLVAGVTARLDDTPNGKKNRYRDVVTAPRGRIIATLSDERGALIEEQDARITLYGLYLQETLRPAPHWSVDLGLRVDYTEFDITTNEIERYDYARGTYVPGAGLFDTNKDFDLFAPRIAATYALTEAINLYATLAQSDQVPSQSEIEKNADLNAATARNIESGLKGRAANWGLDLAVYNTKVDDEIVSVLIDGETTFQNAGETDKKGLEAEGRLRLANRWWVGGSYSYTDYTFDSFTEVKKDTRGKTYYYAAAPRSWLLSYRYNF